MGGRFYLCCYCFTRSDVTTTDGDNSKTRARNVKEWPCFSYVFIAKFIMFCCWVIGGSAVENSFERCLSLLRFRRVWSEKQTSGVYVTYPLRSRVRGAFRSWRRKAVDCANNKNGFKTATARVVVVTFFEKLCFKLWTAENALKRGFLLLLCVCVCTKGRRISTSLRHYECVYIVKIIFDRLLIVLRYLKRAANDRRRQNGHPVIVLAPFRTR